jgi:hypothetical protein
VNESVSNVEITNESRDVIPSRDPTEPRESWLARAFTWTTMAHVGPHSSFTAPGGHSARTTALGHLSITARDAIERGPQTRHGLNGPRGSVLYGWEVHGESRKAP